MTNKEAIKILDQLKYPFPSYPKDAEVNEVVDRAIEALKREQPRGEWGLINVVAMPYLVAYSCPFCKEWGNIQTFKPNFCPNCGADMRGDNNDKV